MIEISNCEVCNNSNLLSVLDLGLHPLCDDLVKIDNERVCKEYPIEILFCDNCFTAHQRVQVPKEELFPKSYHYRARMTGSVLTGMADLVENCEKKFGKITDKVALDIGCNDGSLLDFFKKKGCRTIGIDPTNAIKDSKHDSLQAYFDLKSSIIIKTKVGCPDFITFTNVFAHITNLPELLDSLRLLISKNTIIIIENHYLGAILETNQFDTFYHEHPRTYSHRSFQFIAKSLGLNILDAQYVSRYGGNIRVFLGKGEEKSKPARNETRFINDFIKTQKGVGKWKVDTRKKILNLVKIYGKLRAKAFPGRAAILIKLLGLNESHISAVYEIRGSMKVGYYVPGTRIPILPEAELYSLENQDKLILNLAWHIPGEVRANLTLNGYIGDVLDVKPMTTS
jgi:2-polyprenyl-3-methyl-5-hydroxy-6-metoxy-1,4-benzoquinol methylase